MSVRRKTRKLDQFLHSRTKSHDSVLLESTRLSNRVFRTIMGLALVGLLVVLLRPPTLVAALGLGALLASLTLLGAACISHIDLRQFRTVASFNQFVLLVAAAALVSKLVLVLDWPPCLMPQSAIAMVIAIAYGPVVALFTAVGLSFLTAALSPSATAVTVGADFPRLDFELSVVLSLGSAVAVLGVRRVRKQSRPVIVGFYVGVTQAAAILCFRVLPENFHLPALWGDGAENGELETFFRGIFGDVGFGLVGGLLWGGVVTSLLPVVERFFGVITERRLLDLADPSNNLLRVLRERAPGTFQHTLGVQQLAREASEAIGADALIADVGAYYHDIGKVYKPEYFVENMGEDKSIHSRLRPSMSKLIIISHVKDGVLLAREEKLPEKIIDMIPMHHGTTVVEYFYHKAREQSTEGDRGASDDVEYRYPGPRPSFREAGVLMLADAVEAIAKTISDPTPARFREMVRGVVQRRLLDSQLDECNLTMADLRRIEDSFVRTLTNMYHNRIRYPGGADAPESGAFEEGRSRLAESSRGTRYP